MHSFDKIDQYVKTVCQQIRWKKAHSQIAIEIQNHIIDGRNSYLKQGLDENSATEKAIADTGDAITIGVQLDRIHRPKPQSTMFFATGILLILGLIIRLFAFSGEEPLGSIYDRLLCTGVGIIGMVIAYFSDFTIIDKYPKRIYGCVITISVVALLLSPVLNGRQYYAQYVILLFPLAFSAFNYSMRNKGYWGMVFCGLAFALSGFIALCAQSLSGFIHFAIIGVVLLGIAIHKNWFGTKKGYGILLTLAPLAVIIILFFIMLAPYSLQRLAVTFNPFLDPEGAGYIGVMTRELLSGAAFIGRGNITYENITGSTALPQYLFTDLLLTTLISHLGWIAFLLILAALLFFMGRGFMLCFKQRSSLGLFVSTAIMLTLFMQAASYIAFNLGIQIVSPISLPLISNGNIATMINLVLIGFMLSVFRTGDIVADRKTFSIITHDELVSWIDGKLTINFKLFK